VVTDGTPYRSVQFTVPRPPSRFGRLVALALVVAATVGWAGTWAWRAERARRRRVARETAVAREVARAVALAHAGTLGSGEQVTILRGAGADAVVVRLPGRLVRRGTDLVREPEVLPARDAIALMPDGAWAIDARGDLFDASSAEAIALCARRPCVPSRASGHGRVVQVTADGQLRLENGAVGWGAEGRWQRWWVPPAGARVVDLGGFPDARYALLSSGDLIDRDDRTITTSTLRVPEPSEFVALGTSRSWRSLPALVCVRGARGDVACGTPHELADSERAHVLPVTLAGVARARRLAASATDLCVVDDGGVLRCAVGPAGNSPPDGAPPFTQPVEAAFGDATEVALSNEVGCARRRSGDVVCWGQLLREGGVVRRDAPVEIAGLDAVEHLAAFGDFVCGLQGRRLWCWGAWSLDGPPVSRPVAVATRGPVTAVAASVRIDDNPPQLCVGLAGGGLDCWYGSPFARPPQEVRFVVPVDPREMVFVWRSLCVQAVDSRVWCGRADVWSELAPYFRRVPHFDGFTRLMGVEQELCAIRDGTLSCDVGRNGWMTPADLAVYRRRQHAALRGELARTAPGPDPVLVPLARDGADEVERSLHDALGGRAFAPVPWASSLACMLGVTGRVACRWDDPVPRVTVVPGLDDAVEIAVTRDGLACARRASGRVVCWGRNVGGALTAAESARAPRLFDLDALLPTDARRGLSAPLR